ncbi:MAG: hypothetical protein GX541_06030, partial [Clostridiales bacterium]|nr:hypothetical protein [Clostridiales bacterium]
MLQKSKLSISLFICIALLFGMVPSGGLLFAQADGNSEPGLYMNSVSAEPGDHVIFTISLDCNEYTSLSLNLDYDESVLSYVNHIPIGPLSSSCTVSDNPETGLISISSDSDEPLYCVGHFIAVTFEIKHDAPCGLYDFSLQGSLTAPDPFEGGDIEYELTYEYACLMVDCLEDRPALTMGSAMGK